MITLKRDGNGGYYTADLRFRVEPVTMGTGVSAMGGWSPGHREWLLRLTDGTVLQGHYKSAVNRTERVMHALYAVRDLLDAIYSNE